MIIKAIFLCSVLHYSLGYFNADIEEFTNSADGDRKDFPGYKYYPEVKSWLKLYTDAADWYTARMNCHDEGAILAAPVNHQMLHQLKTILTHSSYARNETISVIYVAISVNYPEGIYVYQKGEPVLKSDVQKLNTCVVYHANDTSMSLTNCERRLPYICQAPTDSDCGGDKGYQLDSRTGQCYKFHTQCLPWNDAHRKCLDDGAHLAIANSQTEANVLTDIFAKYPFEALNGTHPLWGVMAVGFYYWKDADKYVTIYGETLEEAGYARWSSGNPSSRGSRKELGGGMFRSGLLDDVDKSYKVPFICEKSPIRLQIENDDFLYMKIQ